MPLRTRKSHFARRQYHCLHNFKHLLSEYSISSDFCPYIIKCAVYSIFADICFSEYWFIDYYLLSINLVSLYISVHRRIVRITACRCLSFSFYCLFIMNKRTYVRIT